MSRPRVLLAEDHEAVREQLRVLLQADFEVIAAVADGYALVGAAQALRPDVIVTDVAMPGLSGLEAAVRLIATDSAARVIFVSVHTEAALVRRGLEIGAVGYVLKQSAGEELVEAVRTAMLGERFVSPALTVAAAAEQLPKIEGGPQRSQAADAWD
jgi:DNA-binding NarL/FixJ family response regulator